MPRDRGEGRLPTPRDYAGVHTVAAICTGCARVATLDLSALIAGGSGGVALVRLPLRCSACGKRGHKDQRRRQSVPRPRLILAGLCALAIT
jgi:hypothetical protein